MVLTTLLLIPLVLLGLLHSWGLVSLHSVNCHNVIHQAPQMLPASPGFNPCAFAQTMSGQAAHEISSCGGYGASSRLSQWNINMADCKFNLSPLTNFGALCLSAHHHVPVHWSRELCLLLLCHTHRKELVVEDLTELLLDYLLNTTAPQ